MEEEMTKFEVITLIIAGLSILISLIAVFLSGKASVTNKRMFKRQGVIDLHMAWQDINDIDPKNLIGPDIVKAVNALSLTASLWNHDVIEKSILYQSYWGAFEEIYNKLVNLDELVPGHKKTCKSLITAEIKKAYKGMDETDLDTVIQTTI
jgi:hypothetical protein